MIAEPNCYIRKCKHYIGVDQPDGKEMTERNICSAFPKGTYGIPNIIAYGDNEHHTPFADQGNNIVFEDGR